MWGDKVTNVSPTPPKDTRFPYDQVYAFLGIVAFACWSLLILGPLTVPGRGLDFPIFYTAASLPLDELYHLETQAVFQKELWKPWPEFDNVVTSPFPRAPFYALLLKPWAGLDYVTALHIWLVLQFLACVASALLVRKLYGGGPGILFLLISFYPFSVALRNGQDSPLILLAALLAIHFHRHGRDWPAAAFLAFTFEKFNMVFLLPAALLLKKKTSFLVKLTTAVAGIAALSVALIGLNGVRAYYQLLTDGSLDARFWDAWNIRALVWRFGWNEPLYVLLTVLVLAWLVVLLHKLEFETAFWLSITGSLLISWHSFNHDYSVSLPLMYLAWSRYRVYTAAFLLVFGLWPHHYYMERMSWLVTIALLVFTIELWWKSRSLNVPKEALATSSG